jgi:hypothetical protein
VPKLALLALSGCNVVIDEGTFFDEYPTEICQRGITCLWPDMTTLEACVEGRQAILEERQDDCGLFDKDEAALCLRALDNISCDDIDYRFADVDPTECVYVYDCSDTTYVPTTPTTSY